MRHLEEKDIARFADGNISKAEREAFLEHFSQCESCLKAYTDTLKFAAERRTASTPSRICSITLARYHPGKSSFFYAFLQDMSKKKLAVPALAFLILLLVIFSPLIRKTTTDESNTAKLKYIEGCIMKKENRMKYGLFPSKNLINSAIRAGFLTEDLDVVLHSGGKKELKIKITGMLETELKKIFEDEGKMDPAFLRLQEMSKTNFKKMALKIRQMLKSKSLCQLYQFGRFVEGSILSTFEKKTPKKNELEKYLQIMRKYNLPESVLDKLEEIKKTSGIIERRKLWNDVKEIF